MKILIYKLLLLMLLLTVINSTPIERIVYQATLDKEDKIDIQVMSQLIIDSLQSDYRSFKFDDNDQEQLLSIFREDKIFMRRLQILKNNTYFTLFFISNLPIHLITETEVYFQLYINIIKEDADDFKKEMTLSQAKEQVRKRNNIQKTLKIILVKKKREKKIERKVSLNDEIINSIINQLIRQMKTYDDFQKDLEKSKEKMMEKWRDKESFDFRRTKTLLTQYIDLFKFHEFSLKGSLASLRQYIQNHSVIDYAEKTEEIINECLRLLEQIRFSISETSTFISDIDKEYKNIGQKVEDRETYLEEINSNIISYEIVHIRVTSLITENEEFNKETLNQDLETLKEYQDKFRVFQEGLNLKLDINSIDVLRNMLLKVNKIKDDLEIIIKEGTRFLESYEDDKNYEEFTTETSLLKLRSKIDKLIIRKLTSQIDLDEISIDEVDLDQVNQLLVKFYVEPQKSYYHKSILEIFDKSKWIGISKLDALKQVVIDIKKAKLEIEEYKNILLSKVKAFKVMSSPYLKLQEKIFQKILIVYDIIDSSQLKVLDKQLSETEKKMKELLLNVSDKKEEIEAPQDKINLENENTDKFLMELNELLNSYKKFIEKKEEEKERNKLENPNRPNLMRIIGAFIKEAKEYEDVFRVKQKEMNYTLYGLQFDSKVNLLLSNFSETCNDKENLILFYRTLVENIEKNNQNLEKAPSPVKPTPKSFDSIPLQILYDKLSK